ncbi:MAG TPA: hypothetical protein VJ624_04710, partial [Thermodesulfobacteriota bacterium]|nr:hypothetical protein [Thermodesulfobacteriota bacterium]
MLRFKRIAHIIGGYCIEICRVCFRLCAGLVFLGFLKPYFIFRMTLMLGISGAALPRPGECFVGRHYLEPLQAHQ